MVPTPLGLSFLAAFKDLDHELCEPKIRSFMEKEVAKIADGDLTKNEVVDKNLNLFCNKFSRFKARLADVNRFFEFKGALQNQVHGQSGWQQNNHGNGFGGYDGG